jgi:hypothetical protein
VGGGVLTDHLQLVFGGVLLVLGEHAHVLRCPEGRCGFGDALAVFSIRMPPNLAESKSPMLFGIWRVREKLRLLSGKATLFSRHDGQI